MNRYRGRSKWVPFTGRFRAVNGAKMGSFRSQAVKIRTVNGLYFTPQPYAVFRSVSNAYRKRAVYWPFSHPKWSDIRRKSARYRLDLHWRYSRFVQALTVFWNCIILCWTVYGRLRTVWFNPGLAYRNRVQGLKAFSLHSKIKKGQTASTMYMVYHQSKRRASK